MNYGKRNINKLRKKVNSKTPRRVNRFLLTAGQLIVIALIGISILGMSLGIGAFKGVIDSAPEIGNIDVTPSGFSTFVYDSDGNEIAKLVSTNSNRIPVTADMVPENLSRAFVAIEDERFYEHHGIDIQGIIRAAVKGISHGFHFTEGASTITQQLLKNNVFTGWTSETKIESIRRKIQEQYLAVELEKNMDKSTILLNYMNTINLGHNTLGIQSASLRYFGKSVSDLTLSECAVIAGITQNPTRFDPIINPENNKKRRDMVLNSMLKLNYISQEQYDDAQADNVYSRIQVVDKATDDTAINSYFVDALTDQVISDLKDAGYSEAQSYSLLYSGGLNIYSTQDSTIQKIAEEECANPENYPSNVSYNLNYQLSVQNTAGEVKNYSSEMMQEYFRKQNASFTMYFSDKEKADAAIAEYRSSVVGSGDQIIGETTSLLPQPQISLTIEDQKTGNVVAMIGGRGIKTANRTLNRATGVTRQPGSTFKIVAVYAPALDSAGMTLATVQDDAPYTYENGTPVRNWYGENYRGLSSLRLGIQDSMNIVAVKTLTDITPQLGYDYLIKFGFTTLAEHELVGNQVYTDIKQPLALGGLTYGVKNIELNASYAAIANGGVYIKPKLYSRITDHNGKIILDSGSYPERRVLKDTTAWLLTSAMEDVVTKGTGAGVNFGTTPIAGKTGTTSDYNDVWFSGYTNYYTATTWAGFDDNTKLSSSQEKKLAQTIWRKVMSKVHENLPSSDFTMPSGITTATVCALSGKLPVPGLCDETLKTEYFAQDNVPDEPCDVHFDGWICEYTGLPATEFCPFRIHGAVTLSEGGQRCIHDEAFMSQGNIHEILAQQQLEIDHNRQIANTEQLNNYLQAAAQLVAQRQAELEQAEQSGDPNAIAAAQAAYDQALTDYQNAEAAMQSAQNGNMDPAE